ncbi:MAG: GGDEF domain-containing protein [Methylotenera sp.]
MLKELNHPPRWLIIAFAILILGIIGYIDSRTVRDISVGFLYFGPVILATWYAGRKAGSAIALIATITIMEIDLSTRFYHLHPAFAYWNGFLKFLTFSLVIFLVSKHKYHLDFEKSLARTDALTGISNRLTFTEQLNTLFNLAQRGKEPFTLAYIDVDNFKYINDNYGHDEGDNILRLLATAIVTTLRRTDIVARLGGDEFAVLLPNTDSTGAQRLIEKAMVSIREDFHSKPSPVTISIGAVTFKTLPESAGEALKIADQLMYEVKNRGKNSVKFSTFNNKQATDL